MSLRRVAPRLLPAMESPTMVPPSRGLSAQAPRNARQTGTGPEPSPGAWLPLRRPAAYARGWPSLRRPIVKTRKIVVRASLRDPSGTLDHELLSAYLSGHGSVFNGNAFS